MIPVAALPALATAASGALSFFGASQANKANAAQAAANMQAQREFAKHGIRWKVNDAREAGIHPLYALGAQTTSYSPVTLGATNEMAGPAAALAGMSQDISRAQNATRTAPERVAAVEKTYNDLTLQNMGLKNELLASQIAKLKTTINPPFPELGDVQLPEGKQDDRTPLVAFGKKLAQNHGFSDGQTFEDRWGEWGGGAAGLAVLAADLIRTGHLGLSGLRRSPWGAREAWHSK